ncbi:MAG: hypothetical protein GY898_12730 [Proteobacteria bacterium]|nr:hypothetical protein [Pseudomonadota bacterium]
MNSALPLADIDDPRLQPLIVAALRAHKLETSWEGTISQLATGKMSARSMHCCGSGCRPCVQELLRCTVDVLCAYHDPAQERALLQPSGLRGRLGGLARRAANRLARK